MAESVAEPGRLLSVPELAQYLGLSRSATKRIPPAELPFSRVGARGDRRYQAGDVERYVAARRVTS